jgi:hypothetical protein
LTAEQTADLVDRISTAQPARREYYARHESGTRAPHHDNNVIRWLRWAARPPAISERGTDDADRKLQDVKFCQHRGLGPDGPIVLQG